MEGLTKVKSPNPSFTAQKISLEKFETNLQDIEKFHSKLLKSQKDLAITFRELGGAFESLGGMETQVAEPLIKFGAGLEKYVGIMIQKTTVEELEYVSPLHQYANYCGAVKETLKIRDQKQVLLR